MAMIAMYVHILFRDIYESFDSEQAASKSDGS